MPQINDYVLATKWSDGEPGDHWCVGFYKGVLPKISGARFLVADGEGKLFRANGFRRIAKISLARGKWILEHAAEIEAGRRSLWWWKRRSMKNN